MLRPAKTLSLRRVVLDRTFVDADGIRWIIDYKRGECGGEEAARLDAQVERHRGQLEGYADVQCRIGRLPP